jgi:PRTRC genetic system protein A
MTDPRDLALQGSCPTLSAPRFGALPDMENGQRVIVAANGVFVQVKLDWLDCTMRIAHLAPAPALPFGALHERVAFTFGVIPVTLLDRFVEAGREELPNEVAGGLIYSGRTKGLRLAVFDAIRTSPDRIDYRMPELASDETIAVDLHTHGRDAAFWSSTDNLDDRGIKVAGVFGHLDQARPSAAFRLAINGHYLPLRHPWEPQAEHVPARPGRLDARGCRSILKWLGVQRGGA